MRDEFELSKEEKIQMLRQSIKSLTTQKYQLEIDIAINYGNINVTNNMGERLKQMEEGKGILIKRLEELESAKG